tara:strand:- start:4871 stop:5704 length:834 start_codon:yes stop_codon:yes gene_type:complete
MTRLLTLGCSWVKGVGSQYDSDNPSDKKSYQKYCQGDDTWKYAFRTILAQKYGLQNVNIACAGASNSNQSRSLKKYLHKNTLDDTIVMWGVTSIYRMELFFNHIDRYWCFQPTQENYKNVYGPNWCGPKEFFRQHFKERDAKRTLADDVYVWQQYFDALGVPQIWFDTLNVNHYIGGLYKEFNKLPYDCNQDLLSQLAYKTGWNPKDDKYHFSDWEADCDRIEHLKREKVVNPHSFHPTRQGHQQIAEILDPILKDCLDNNRPNINPYITRWKDVHD